MAFFNSEAPLGLPKGSVRAIIALTLITTTAYLSVTTGEVPEGLIALSGAVGIYYFKTRESQ